MTAPDRFDQEAERLLPCDGWYMCKASNEHEHPLVCTATHRPAVAVALRRAYSEGQRDKEDEFDKGYNLHGSSEVDLP